jgi:hypothetical protein
MPVRQLIIAVLMLLSLSAQASAALLSCGESGPTTAACCDSHRPTPGCPSPGDSSLSCDQACSTGATTEVSATLEHEQPQPVPVDPIDEPATLAAAFYELLAAVDVREPVRQPVEPPVTRYPTSPTYLATARLRI